MNPTVVFVELCGPMIVFTERQRTLDGLRNYVKDCNLRLRLDYL